MDFTKHVYKTSMGLSILYFIESNILMSKLCISDPEDCFVFANSADPDEKLRYVALYQGLHCFGKSTYLRYLEGKLNAIQLWTEYETAFT